jgi:hypothetical protein
MRLVARKAIAQMLEPLVGFVLDSGLSPQELHSILREAAIRSVAERQLKVARRINISGIAASTGIPRAEISRILKSKDNSLREFADRQQQTTNRVLSAWHQDPKFTTTAGKPAELKIYGRGATFETLVRACGRGIPTRAMLDELTRIGAAEVLTPHQIIRVKSAVAVDRGTSNRAVRTLGCRVAELMSTMLQNMRSPQSPRFVATVSSADISPALLPLFRKELAGKGANFLAEIHDLLNQETIGASESCPSGTRRVSVTVFCHEAGIEAKSKKSTVGKRRNFRRSR